MSCMKRYRVRACVQAGCHACRTVFYLVPRPVRNCGLTAKNIVPESRSPIDLDIPAIIIGRIPLSYTPGPKIVCPGFLDKECYLHRGIIIRRRIEDIFTSGSIGILPDFHDTRPADRTTLCLFTSIAVNHAIVVQGRSTGRRDRKI